MHKKSIFRQPLVVVLALCLLGFSAQLAAQAKRPELTGLVKDVQGAVIPGAEVAVTNEATGVTRITVTTDVGAFTMISLVGANYRVEVSLPGFKTYVREGFTLIQGTNRLDVVLEVGEVTEKVTVTGEAPLLKTESNEAMTKQIATRELTYLPNLRNRTYDRLIRLSALVGRTGWQSNHAHNWHFVAGNDHWSAGFYLNGTAAGLANGGTHGSAHGIHREFVDQFSITAQSFSAEYTGAWVAIVQTKGGTNDFHGQFNMLWQDDALNATNWGAGTKLPFREREWGANIGGPVFKDKTHFFFGYQNRHWDQSLPKFATLPTNLQRAGDFSQTLDTAGNVIPIFDPATHRADPNNADQFIRDQFPGNVIPADRFDPVSVAILSFLPAPNLPGSATGSNNWTGPNTTNLLIPQWITRVDQQWNDSHTTFGSWMDFAENTKFPPGFGTPGVNFDGQHSNRYEHGVWLATLVHTYVPSPNWVLESSFAANWYRWLSYDDGYGQDWPNRLGLQGVVHGYDVFPRTAMEGFEIFGHVTGTVWSPPDSVHGMHSYGQKFTHYRGAHGIKFGIEAYEVYQGLPFGSAGPPGAHNPVTNLDFTAQATANWKTAPISGTGSSVASMLLGQPHLAKQYSRQAWWYTYLIPQFYFEDNWKVRDNFSLNFGIRQEHFLEPDVKISTGPFINECYWADFGYDVINPVSGTPGALLYGCRPGGPSGIHAVDDKWLPRIGFAWQPKGAGTGTVIRLGIGLIPHVTGQTVGAPGLDLAAYDVETFDQGLTPPFFLKDGFPEVPVSGETLPGPGFGAVPVGDDPVISPNFQQYNEPNRGYSYQGNFGIQNEIGFNAVLDITYYMTLGRGVRGSRLQLNQIHPSNFGPGAAQTRRPYPQYGNVGRGWSNLFNSTYHAGQIKLDKRYSAGLNFTMDYVFSKWMTENNPWNVYDIADSWSQYFGGGQTVAQHVFVTYAIYDLPFGYGRRWSNSGPIAHIIGNWNLSSIVRLQNGGYMDINYNQDTTNGFVAQQGVDLNGNPNMSGDSRTMARYFNTDAFAAPGEFRFGNNGRVNVQYPGFWGVDLALHRQFRLHEHVSGTVSLEAENIFNHPNLNQPGGTWGNADFGVIGSKSGNRQVQIGFKLMF